MFRRRFLQLVAFSSVGVVAPLEVMGAAATKSVTYLVKGFSCPTCAVGLDTMLRQQKGIASSKSTYPEGKVTVSFSPDVVTENAICAFIAEMGFVVEAGHKS